MQQELRDKLTRQARQTGQAQARAWLHGFIMTSPDILDILRAVAGDVVAAQEKKDVKAEGHARDENKGAKATTKILPGHVERRLVRCGKTNCKCARGEPHEAHYHVFRSGGKRHQKYIKRVDVAEVEKACNVHREEQAHLRRGRAFCRRDVERARALLRVLGNEQS